MSKLSMVSLVAAFALYNASQLLSSLRLFTLMKHKDFGITKKLMAKIYYRSMFFSAITPISVGADAYKIWLFVKKFGMGLKKSSFIVIWERVLGSTALLSILLILWNLEWDINKFIPHSLSLFVIFFVISGAYLVLPASINGIDLRSNINAFIASLGIQFLQVSCFCIIASSILPGDDMIKVAMLFLASSISSFLPISYSGLGAREAVFVMGGKYLGVNVDALVAASLVFQVIHFSTASIGSFVKPNINMEGFGTDMMMNELTSN